MNWRSELSKFSNRRAAAVAVAGTAAFLVAGWFLLRPQQRRRTSTAAQTLVSVTEEPQPQSPAPPSELFVPAPPQEEKEHNRDNLVSSKPLPEETTAVEERPKSSSEPMDTFFVGPLTLQCPSSSGVVQMDLPGCHFGSTIRSGATLRHPSGVLITAGTEDVRLLPSMMDVREYETRCLDEIVSFDPSVVSLQLQSDASDILPGPSLFQRYVDLVIGPDDEHPIIVAMFILCRDGVACYLMLQAEVEPFDQARDFFFELVMSASLAPYAPCATQFAFPARVDGKQTVVSVPDVFAPVARGSYDTLTWVVFQHQSDAFTVIESQGEVVTLPPSYEPVVAVQEESSIATSPPPPSSSSTLWVSSSLSLPLPSMEQFWSHPLGMHSNSKLSGDHKETLRGNLFLRPRRFVSADELASFDPTVGVSFSENFSSHSDVALWTSHRLSIVVKENGPPTAEELRACFPEDAQVRHHRSSLSPTLNVASASCVVGVDERRDKLILWIDQLQLSSSSDRQWLQLWWTVDVSREKTTADLPEDVKQYRNELLQLLTVR